MAKKKDAIVPVGDDVDITKILIDDINKQLGHRSAYNLSEASAPTVVKRWIPTGSTWLDYCISNRGSDGGYPEGRIIEIAGLPSLGKSHLGYVAAANVQKMGGMVVYIDTENATMLDKLGELGVDVEKNFVYVDNHCTEDVFSIIEKTVEKAHILHAKKDVPILVVWDSVAATSPKAELDGEYDQQTMGLQARTLSKGFRKLTPVIAENNVTMICLNQLRSKLNLSNPYEDPYVSPGGAAIPFHASVRIRLTGGSKVKDPSGGYVVGAHVRAECIKNKVSAPFQKCEFDILFGIGLHENDFLFDAVRSWCDEDGPAKGNGVEVSLSGSGAWKTFSVNNDSTGEVILEKKFYKQDFKKILSEDDVKPFAEMLFDAALKYKKKKVKGDEADDNAKDQAEG